MVQIRGYVCLMKTPCKGCSITKIERLDLCNPILLPANNSMYVYLYKAPVLSNKLQTLYVVMEQPLGEVLIA